MARHCTALYVSVCNASVSADAEAEVCGSEEDCAALWP